MMESIADMPGGYMLEATIAKQLNLTPQTLRKWRRQGKGPAFIKIGRRIFYRVASCDAWLKSREIQPVREVFHTEAAA
jgi:Helix-turn-helix domain